MKNDILDLIPKHAEKRLGGKEEAYAGYTPLDVPSWISDSGVAAVMRMGFSLVIWFLLVCFWIWLCRSGFLSTFIVPSVRAIHLFIFLLS